MIQSIRFIQRYRCYAEGEVVELRAGVNLLVGDQGSGKSSLIHAIVGERRDERAIVRFSGPTVSRYLDFEKGTLRNRSHFHENDRLFMPQVLATFRSHGEHVLDILRAAPPPEPGKTTLYLLDEPDMALSPRSAHALSRRLVDLATPPHQILAAVHNPIVILSQPEVLSLEHRRWMPSWEYLALHGEGSVSNTGETMSKKCRQEVEHYHGVILSAHHDRSRDRWGIKIMLWSYFVTSAHFYPSREAAFEAGRQVVDALEPILRHR